MKCIQCGKPAARRLGRFCTSACSRQFKIDQRLDETLDWFAVQLRRHIVWQSWDEAELARRSKWADSPVATGLIRVDSLSSDVFARSVSKLNAEFSTAGRRGGVLASRLDSARKALNGSAAVGRLATAAYGGVALAGSAGAATNCGRGVGQPAMRKCRHVRSNLEHLVVRSDIKPDERFGRFKILGVPFAIRSGIQRRTCVVCECDCGSVRVVALGEMRRGSAHSCGCDQKKRWVSHASSYRTPLYFVWLAMKERCYSRNNKSFCNYGGRGVRVCVEWKTSFTAFHAWAMSNGYERGLSIDRKDNAGHYCPENCRWATAIEQANNKRTNVLITAWGETKSATAWTRDPRCFVQVKALKKRVKKGWSPEQSMTTPPYSLLDVAKP